MLITTIINKAERGRPEELGGESYTVYPVVMLTVGVHSGSGGPTLYTEEELSTFSQTWNGVPVTLHHPSLNGMPVSANSPEIYDSQVVGTLFNTVYENGKLKGEIWLNNSDLDMLDPGLKGRLLSGERLEVSTGLFSDSEEVEGTFNNEQYISIARNIRPDHLALLPGDKGACSWEDGCGVRVNKKEEKGETDMIRRKKAVVVNSNVEKQKDKFFINSKEVLSINEVDYTKLIDLMYTKIDSMDVQGESSNYLRRVYEDYVVYSISYRNSNQPNKLVKRNYNIVNDVIEFTSDPVQVTESVSYTEINNNSKEKQEKSMEKVKTMRECCPDKVNELIKNNANFTEDHREALLGMSEDAFALTINVAKDLNVVENVEKKKKVEKEEVIDNKEKQITMNDLPKEMRDSIEYGQKSLARDRAVLINKIKENKSNPFSDDELDEFGIDHLDKLSKMTPTPKVNYGPSYVANTETTTKVTPLPKVNTFEEEKK